MKVQTSLGTFAAVIVIAAGFIGSGLVASPARGQEANRVEVELTEFAIDMPNRLPPGPTVFEVVNSGQAEHTIALLTTALLAEGLLAATGRQRYDEISRFCVRLGAATGLVAGVLGWFFAGFRITDSVELMTIHRWFGTGTVAWAALVLVLSERSRGPEGASLRPWFRAALVIAVLAVLTTGFFGGAMIYGLDHYGWW